MTHGKRGEANGEGKKEKSTFFPHHNRINRMENQVAPWFSRACAIMLAAPEMMEIGPRGMMAIIRNRGIACTPRLPISPCPVIRV